ncbi:hypothetical protein [Arthrobacter alpinus]|uniref:hypothetical protein n=1 Tax=Arthrobacter alpinus TaxID=656366 RepID=UPI00164879C5|nr:hypothetical protein [Arthrobacter alpinus]
MITEQEVIEWSGQTQNVQPFALIIPAVNRYVDNLPSIDRLADGSWAGNTRLGAILLATRWYARKDSASGTYGSADGTVFISKYDSDIARLLNIDGHSKPMVG